MVRRVELHSGNLAGHLLGVGWGVGVVEGTDDVVGKPRTSHDCTEAWGETHTQRHTHTHTHRDQREMLEMLDVRDRIKD